jgi:hypothetical protein
MKRLLLNLSFIALLISCQNEQVITPSETSSVVEDKAATKVMRCGYNLMLKQHLKNDPTLAGRMAEIEKQTNLYLKSAKAENKLIVIPVVFNVLYNVDRDNISKEQIQSQIDVLNKDFNGTNSDFNRSSPYNNRKAKVGIRFVLDKINRKKSTITKWLIEDEFMKKVSRGGIAPTAPNDKLNIWVVNNLTNRDNLRILGYAQFPGLSPSTDGIILGNYATGVNGTAAAPFNLGRTATHEVGHWMNLIHIWGDANCGDDLVGDTPAHDSQNLGKPAVGLKSTCKGNPLEMYMNYMDYVDDDSMFMFTNGQKSRMLAVFGPKGPRKSFNK